MHFLRMALSGLVYRLMPKKLVDHMGLSFPLSSHCDWRVIFCIFISVTVWWHSKGVSWACCTHLMELSFSFQKKNVYFEQQKRHLSVSRVRMAMWGKVVVYLLRGQNREKWDWILVKLVKVAMQKHLHKPPQWVATSVLFPGTPQWALLTRT